MGGGEKPADTQEDCPIVKQLKEIDDKYLELQKEYERECQKLLLQFSEKQQPLLEERRRMLTAPEGSCSANGTPALKAFWLTAMQNHPAVGEGIQEWDEPVLEHLSDVEKRNVDDADATLGFKLVFRFSENPYFSNAELWKEYSTELTNPYIGEVEVKEVRCCKIDWKAGKDVTVERVPRKVKGGGQKKGKHKRDKEEPRASFFRDFFRNLHKEMSLEEDAREQALVFAQDEGDDDDENLLMYLMESDHEIGMALRDSVIPYAVRWYTGEASPDFDDDGYDEDEEEEEEKEEEEDVDEEEEDEPHSKATRGKPLKKGGSGGASSPDTKPAEAPIGKEECKQQ